MTDNIIIQNNCKRRNLWVPVLVSLLVAQFLFFLDEGYHDFRWMKIPGNWIVYFIYAGFLFGGQMLIKWLFFRKTNGFNAAVSIIGLVVGLGFALLVFSGVWR